jgi:hypothetical protein
MVGNQIGNLTPDPYLSHNLCLSVQMGHANPFQTCKFQELFIDIMNFSIQWVLTHAIALWKLGVHWDFNSQSGSSFGSARVHSLTLSYTPGSMRCDSQASFLARNLASVCLGHELRARVATLILFVDLSIS